MLIFSRFLKTYRQYLFEPGFISFLINPFYLTRSSLYRIVSNYSPSFTGKILDIGCGSKPYRSLFKNVDEYVGLDVQVSGHDHSTSDVDVFYDGRFIPFDEKTFDAVVSFETFEHVFNLPELLVEVHRVLKPGGRLMISIPFCWPEHEQPYDFARYTSFGISQVLKSACFDIQHLVKSGDYLSAVLQIFIEYIRAQLFPRSRLGQAFIQIMIILPVLLVGQLALWVLPRRYEYYFGVVIVAAKVEVDSATNSLSVQD